MFQKQRFKKRVAYNINMEKKYFADFVINKERLSDGKIVFVANCPSLGVASQGYTKDEAKKNLKEAVELYLEEQPEKYDSLTNKGTLFSIEVTKSAKTTAPIRH